jgi:hypothetical protein
MKTLQNKNEGTPAIICKVCGEVILSKEFLARLDHDELSFIEKMQINGLRKIAKTGAKVVGLAVTEDFEETKQMLLMTHFTHKSATLKRGKFLPTTDKEHIEVLKKAISPDFDIYSVCQVV